MPLPRHFCWTRFGTEAGETIDHILMRKEYERQANGGLFLWGIGNAIGPSMRELVLKESSPEVIFSPIRSKPRKEDIQPAEIVAWTAGRTLDGRYYDLPRGSVVTSRASLGKRRQKHYALVCGLTDPLQIKENTEAIPLGQLRNLLTNKKIGASQVTAIVSLDDTFHDSSGVAYAAVIRAELVYPYLVELIDPVLLPTACSSSRGKKDMAPANIVERIKWHEECDSLRDPASVKIVQALLF